MDQAFDLAATQLLAAQRLDEPAQLPQWNFGRRLKGPRV